MARLATTAAHRVAEQLRAQPAAMLQDHPDVLFFIDEAAASGLKRVITVGQGGNQPAGYKEKP